MKPPLLIEEGRRQHSCTVVAMIVAGSWTPAAAQPSNDEWKVLVEPYLMGAAMNGTTTIRERDVDIDASASNIFSNLQFGAMGLVVATKGNWGFGTDGAERLEDPEP